MAKYIVTACSIYRFPNGKNGKSLVATYKMNECVRKDGKKGKFYSDELVDTSDDGQSVFGAKNEYQVENKYEAFWNRINGGYNNQEIVKVLFVEKQ